VPLPPVPVAAPALSTGTPVLSTRVVLAALDRGASQLEQAMELIRAAGGIADPGTLTLGELDRALLAEHRAVLGSGLEMVATCAACGVPSCFPIDEATLPEPAPRSAWQAPGTGLREPRIADLLGLPADPETAAQVLAARCAAGPEPGPRDPDLLEQVDTALHGTVTGGCVDCGHPVSAVLDVASSVLRAFAAWCSSYEAEVDLLAARYGWSLEAIDALPDPRRRRLAEYAGSRS
jgi:hypothetical protein